MSNSASQFAFAPLGNTHLIASANPAPTPVQISTFANQPAYGQYRIINSSASNLLSKPVSTMILPFLRRLLIS